MDNKLSPHSSVFSCLIKCTMGRPGNESRQFSTFAPMKTKISFRFSIEQKELFSPHPHKREVCKNLSYMCGDTMVQANSYPMTQLCAGSIWLSSLVHIAGFYIHGDFCVWLRLPKHMKLQWIILMSRTNHAKVEAWASILILHLVHLKSL